MKTINTERLVLTPWQVTREDAEGLYAYAKHEEVGPNAGWKPHESVEESLEIIRDLFAPSISWAIREKDTNRIIGHISLDHDKRREDVKSLELGYNLARDCWGKGYMTEAAKAVMEYAFKEMELVIMAVVTGPDNKRSQRVIEKCGFKYEGRQRKAYHIWDGSEEGFDRDNLVYSILKEEWEDLISNKK